MERQASVSGGGKPDGYDHARLGQQRERQKRKDSKAGTGEHKWPHECETITSVFL